MLDIIYTLKKMAPKSRSKKSSSAKEVGESSSDLKQVYDPDKTAVHWDSLPADLRPGYDANKNSFIERFLRDNKALIDSADTNGHNRDKSIRRLVGVAEEIYSLNVKYNDLPAVVKKKYANPDVVAGRKVDSREDIKDLIKFGTESNNSYGSKGYILGGTPLFAKTAAQAQSLTGNPNSVSSSSSSSPTVTLSPDNKENNTMGK